MSQRIDAKTWATLAQGSGIPKAAMLLFGGLGVVAVASIAMITLVPFPSATFGTLTAPVILGAGFADGFNPCAFALLVLFATYTLTLVNAVTSDGRPTPSARRTLLGAGSLYVGAVFITYFLLGLGLYTLFGGFGQDHIVARVAAVMALGMAVWMLKDVFLPGWGPSMAAPSGTHGLMNKAMARGGLAGMLIAGILVGICTVPCSGAMYLSVTAVLHASGGGGVGLAYLALYNVAFILPLLLFLVFVSNRRVLGTIGRWNKKNGAVVKSVLALGVIAMSEYLRFPIEGMTCTSCASRITRAVRKLDGVESVKVDLGSDSGDVAFDPARTSLEAIAEVIRRGGYEAQIEHADAFTPAERRSLRARLGLGR